MAPTTLNAGVPVTPITSEVSPRGSHRAETGCYGMVNAVLRPIRRRLVVGGLCR